MAKVRSQTEKIGASAAAVQRDDHLDVWTRQWLDGVRVSTTKPSTYDFYETICRNHLSPGVGQLRMSTLTPSRMERILTGHAVHGAVGGSGALRGRRYWMERSFVLPSFEVVLRDLSKNHPMTAPAYAATRSPGRAPLCWTQLLVLSWQSDRGSVDSGRCGRRRAGSALSGHHLID